MDSLEKLEEPQTASMLKNDETFDSSKNLKKGLKSHLRAVSQDLSKQINGYNT